MPGSTGVCSRRHRRTARSSVTETEPSPDPNLATMSTRATTSDYRGKWHLNKKGEAGAFDATPEDLWAHGFDGWVAP